MAIKDFASDGAFGAAGSSTGSSGTAEQSAMGYGGTPSGYGGHTNQSTTPAATQSLSPLNPLGSNFNPSAVALAGGGFSLPVDAGSTDTSQGSDAGSSYFADGGAVDDGGDSSGGDGSGDVGSLLALALSSVDAGLDYGRKKYGLDGGGQQQASMTSRTPAIPGNQSESGIPRPQPMPGPLPPTSNPFGQRRQFGQNDQDQDDQGTQTAQAGAIPDNDEDDQEGTA